MLHKASSCCFVNLPYGVRIMRRYGCTYYAPNFLFPPLELMSLAAIVKEWKKGDCVIIDAIAEGLDIAQVIERLKSGQPDLLVFMAGIESFGEDMKAVNSIKSEFNSLRICCIGHLPSVSPKDTLEQNPAIDFVIMGEPEVSFSQLYDCLQAASLSGELQGVAYRGDRGQIVIGSSRSRIKDLDALPHPARQLIRKTLYNEFLFKKPFTVIQASRGCPFECSFCVNTYGKDMAYRSKENILSEMDTLRAEGIRAIRFMDDTFTLNKVRCVELCEGMIKRDFRFDWSCLSRVDTLDGEMLAIMKKAGCRRIYLGIETFSQRLLDYYRKGYDAALIRPQVRMIKENKIEVAGFFMVGGIQTEGEFNNDVSQAKQAGLNYVVVEKFTLYPGTPIFANMKNICNEEEAVRREKEFYRAFYLRPGYVFSRIKGLVSNFKDTASGWKSLRGYLTKSQNTSPRPELI